MVSTNSQITNVSALSWDGGLLGVVDGGTGNTGGLLGWGGASASSSYMKTTYVWIDSNDSNPGVNITSGGGNFSGGVSGGFNGSPFEI